MRDIYLVLFFVFILQRLTELFLSARNEKILSSQGYKVYFSSDLPWLKIFHVSWFIAQMLEVWLMPFSPPQWVLYISLVTVCMGQVVRFFTQMALGSRWVIPIMANPNFKRVDKGIYKIHSHPNYLAVVIEIFALPLLGGAIITSVVFGMINIFIVSRRIAQEEWALSGGQNVS